jgi:tetratricopeptide (TPR) repeat protein
MVEEAFREYDSLLKTSSHSNNFLIRVNTGNLHFQEGEYCEAIKMYKMAVDMVPTQFELIKFKIRKNIGRCHVQLREFPEAVLVYEEILSQSPDFETAFNLILSLYVLGDKDKMSLAFEQMVQISNIFF